ncbi:hypothetical protein MsAg5_06440 [Methanosarcinaceae archaeon Ag5]|uniref:Uncharacterized protein n=1 Tax=Methanolapillus africanus TaxID=3028297 RepID=A0AAE4MJI6_9EURY|nr:hypothetical protein [Methanosarcinaceae archaeon Ag5]
MTYSDSDLKALGYSNKEVELLRWKSGTMNSSKLEDNLVIGQWVGSGDEDFVYHPETDETTVTIYYSVSWKKMPLMKFNDAVYFNGGEWLIDKPNSSFTADYSNGSQIQFPLYSDSAFDTYSKFPLTFSNPETKSKEQFSQGSGKMVLSHYGNVPYVTPSTTYGHYYSPFVSKHLMSTCTSSETIYNGSDSS